MAKFLSGITSRRRAKADAAVEAPVQAQPAEKVPSKHPRVGLWVLSTFATVAALVSISAMVIGPDYASAGVIIPLVLFWSITVSVGFAIRSALINVVRAVSGRPARVADEGDAHTRQGKAEKPDAALERLARMAQRERNHALAHPHLARGLVHAH